MSPGAGQWEFSVAHTFNGENGALGWHPAGGLTLDASGNLFGTTEEGGMDFECVPQGFACGTIFELSPDGIGRFKFALLASFDFVHGITPEFGVTLDQSGNIFGTALYGGKSKLPVCGQYGCGTAFMLTP